MILVTTQPNDKPLLKELQYLLPDDIAAEPIECGDVQWVGNWTGGTNICLAGDRKRMNDFLSCVESGHHIQQIEDAKERGIDKLFVIWERDRPIKVGPDGFIQLRKGKNWVVRQPKLHISRVWAYIDELYWYLGIPVIETKSLKETARRIQRLYLMTQEPPEKHHTLDMVYTPPLAGFHLTRPSLTYRWARELDGVGPELAKTIESTLKTPLKLALATAWDLQQMNGIGKGKAMSIQSQISTGKGE